MTDTIADHMNALSRAQSIAEIGTSLQNTLNLLGFDTYSYVHVRPPLGKRIRSFVPQVAQDGQVVHEFLATFPDDWVEHYLLQGFSDVDPTFQKAMGTILPFDWREVSAQNDLSNGQRRVFDEARDFGLTTGATIPIHGPESGLSTLNVSSSGSQQQFEESYQLARQDLLWVAVQTHEAFLRLSEDAPEEARVRLTDRERDCLLWTARGKTAWEVGQILKISEETVLFHLKNGTRKLGVFSKHHAVVKAVMQGHIIP